MSTMTVSSIAHCEDCMANTALDIHGRCGKCGSEAVTRRTAMRNLRQAIAASESVRSKFLSGKPFTEEDVRMELSSSTDLRKDYDEAMRLVHDLVGHIQELRKELNATRTA